MAWVSTDVRLPDKSGEYKVRRRAGPEKYIVEETVFFEIRKVRVTHKTWYSMKTGGRLLYVLEWWDENA